MIDHDTVYNLVASADAGWLCEYPFDTDDAKACNGVWSVAYTAISLQDAVARIEALQHGTLPPDIYAANETTAEVLRQRWADYLDQVDAEFAAQSVETN